MSMSIRGRLTLWYSAVVVVVLVTGAIVGSLAQSRLALQGLDDQLTRSMATLMGVMHTEFGEGLTLEGSADEASREVVAPGHGMVLSRVDGTVLAAWGEPIDVRSIVGLPVQTEPVTVDTGGEGVRALVREVGESGHRYRAFVVAPLDSLAAQHAEMTRAISIGVVIALLIAAAGGWLIGRQTLQPLSQMAAQASGINERDPTGRLSAPHADDELGRLATAFNGLLARLAAAMHQQRQFMADASHELRTPVSVVRTAAQVALSKEDRSAGDYQESLAIVEEQANRLTRLVDAMFLLSRAEAKGVPLRKEFVNLDDIVAETVRAARVLAEERRLRVTLEGDQEVGFLGDDGLLRQMVGNLLDNAIRHADSTGIVVVCLSRAPGRIHLRVSNDGPGIDRADYERIFERFVRIGQSDGGGLGLPIARWIAEAHGGTLVLQSSAPGLTTFAVSLPTEPVIGRSSSG